MSASAAARTVAQCLTWGTCLHMATLRNTFELSAWDTIPDSIHRGQSEGVYRNRLSEIAMNTRGAHFVCLSQVVFGACFGAPLRGFTWALCTFGIFVLLSLGIAICDNSVGSHYISRIPWESAARGAFVFFPAHPPFCSSVVWCLPLLLSSCGLGFFCCLVRVVVCAFSPLAISD